MKNPEITGRDPDVPASVLGQDPDVQAFLDRLNQTNVVIDTVETDTFHLPGLGEVVNVIDTL